jgi:hypothetical protein
LSNLTPQLSTILSLALVTLASIVIGLRFLGYENDKFVVLMLVLLSILYI